MTNRNASFTRSIPAVYDQDLGPMFFEPYARDLAGRVTVGEDASVLEVAAGTGIVTRHLHEALPSTTRLVVTDLNEAMLDLARRKIPVNPRIQWRAADAAALPFGDGSFDAAVCRFGLMFFPDKPAALRELHRVLNPTVVMHAVAARLATEGGASPMRLPMRALVFAANRSHT
ncbi:MAG: class I SAM-dependent methyltransferase [Vicinamibacterales bacterium]